MFENILWIAIGFIPTYVAMELAWRIAKANGIISKRKAQAQAVSHQYVLTNESKRKGG
jgi:hypothetical protein